MRATDIIIKKRDGKALTKEEIRFFVQGYTDGSIADYQAAAWAMAVLLKGMNDRETTELALAMADSGEVLDLSGVVDIALDKHSTGGVGDKTTLVVEPIVSACGLRVGKMSGRGLGFSGGTLDKMESIPGYRTDLSKEEFLAQLKDLGLVLTGQTGALAPADGKLYALRDVTGTVESLPLIAASIMSKKLAAGAQRIVLDVKVGSGAFMKTIKEARSLAKIMVKIAKLSNRKAIALLSDMNQPLGNAVGNALEVKEAIDTLKGGGPKDFRLHCVEVASHMLLLGSKASTLLGARKSVETALKSGDALRKFLELVRAQGGDSTFITDTSKFPQPRILREIFSEGSGYLSRVDARIIGEASVLIGAGREKKDDFIDHSVGILVHRKVGDKLRVGDLIFSLFGNDEKKVASAEEHIRIAWSIKEEKVERIAQFYGIVS